MQIALEVLTPWVIWAGGGILPMSVCIIIFIILQLAK
jgi:hypothetical protein